MLKSTRVANHYVVIVFFSQWQFFVVFLSVTCRKPFLSPPMIVVLFRAVHPMRRCLLSVRWKETFNQTLHALYFLWNSTCGQCSDICWSDFETCARFLQDWANSRRPKYHAPNRPFFKTTHFSVFKAYNRDGCLGRTKTVQKGLGILVSESGPPSKLRRVLRLCLHRIYKSFPRWISIESTSVMCNFNLSNRKNWSFVQQACPIGEDHMKYLWS